MIIDPETGRPFGAVPAAKPIVGPTLGGLDGIVVGACVYDADDKLVEFVPSDEDGVLEREIVIEQGQQIVLVQSVAKAIPNPGTTIRRIGARKNG